MTDTIAPIFSAISHLITAAPFIILIALSGRILLGGLRK